MQNFSFGRTLLVLPVILLAGCASALKEQYTEDVAAPEPKVIEEVEIIDSHLDSTEKYQEKVESANIDELLRYARKSYQNEEFKKADSVLKETIDLIRIGIDYADMSWFPLEAYLDDIVYIYSNEMPEEFAVPEMISVLYFKKRLLSTLDTLEVQPEDSIILHKLSSQSEVSYDIPIVWNSRVKRSLLFFMRSRRGIFDRWLKRAGYYLPVKKQMFKDAGLPQDLAYLPILESGFNPVAYSPAHAAGIWQFIPSTGRVYGLRQNYWIDERRDPLKSADAAIRYLSKLYNDFNHWYLALAAYNCGEGRLGRAIRNASSDDYWGLSLPRETMNYVPLYLASLIVAKNPDVFGFTYEEDFVFDRDTVYVHECIELSTIAEGIGIELDTLRRINPHILHWSTPPDMSDVLLYLPNGYAETFREFISDLPDEKKVRWYRYRIRRGDNLIAIARNFGVTVEAIRSVNRLRTNRIIAGNHLYIPLPAVGKETAQRASTPQQRSPSGGQTEGAQRITYRTRPGDTLWRIAQQFGVSVQDICDWNNLDNPEQLGLEQRLIIYRSAPVRSQNTTSTSDSEMAEYVVKSGDSPYSIAKDLGISLSDLLKANNFSSRNPSIFPGDILYYEKSKASASPSATPETSSESEDSKQIIYYQIRQGDNLWRISNLFDISLERLYELNDLQQDAVLMPGDTIKVIRTGDTR
ncbi:LysM peptidoglycan-binding domain-containing protein [Chitinispirillales bacterium ANBcel5]|uniref:LysM peptidoglycan-binding domain-containing protein n=1 Tax=Cellulosispirillum alkaliphilum TaxID=3039283 RepID=UPI002A5130CB|nr:LysM peptidoglycan-binding domain-containing protein [Chitinispirillales bacterium ANBcel5]